MQKNRETLRFRKKKVGKPMNRFQKYWLYASLLSIGLGEIVAPSLVSHPIILFSSVPALLIMAVYYIGLSWSFAKIFTTYSQNIGFATAFVYGVLAEWLVFNNINGLTDFARVLFFGLFYVLLFGLPWVLANKK